MDDTHPPIDTSAKAHILAPDHDTFPSRNVLFKTMSELAGETLIRFDSGIDIAIFNATLSASPGDAEL